MTKRMYDPPSGWQYGFPKEYNPLPDESLAAHGCWFIVFLIT